MIDLSKVDWSRCPKLPGGLLLDRDGATGVTCIRDWKLFCLARLFTNQDGRHTWTLCEQLATKVPETLESIRIIAEFLIAKEWRQCDGSTWAQLEESRINRSNGRCARCFEGVWWRFDDRSPVATNRQKLCVPDLPSGQTVKRMSSGDALKLLFKKKQLDVRVEYSEHFQTLKLFHFCGHSISVEQVTGVTVCGFPVPFRVDLERFLENEWVEVRLNTSGEKRNQWCLVTEHDSTYGVRLNKATNQNPCSASALFNCKTGSERAHGPD